MPPKAPQRPAKPRNSGEGTPAPEMPFGSVPGRLRASLEVSVGALATQPEHAALVEAARFAADCVDASDEWDERRVREYRFALKALMEATAHAGSDAFADLQRQLAAVGDEAEP